MTRYVYIYYFVPHLNKCLTTFHNFFLCITCMVLTWQVPEIEVYISEDSVFSLVNVQVWQWEGWKHTPI